MKATVRRIEASVPEESFALVASAAAKMGLTLRGFASMAIYQMAVSTLKTESELPMNRELRLSQDELANLAKILADPYRNADRISEAHKRVSAIPHREVPSEQRYDSAVCSVVQRTRSKKLRLRGAGDESVHSSVSGSTG